MVRIEHNLCDPSRDVGGYHFNCADKTDPSTWPCTGSEHRLDGVEVICSCECHSRPVGTAHLSWPLPGDGDHSDQRGNG